MWQIFLSLILKQNALDAFYIFFILDECSHAGVATSAICSLQLVDPRTHYWLTPCQCTIHIERDTRIYGWWNCALQDQRSLRSYEKGNEEIPSGLTLHHGFFSAETFPNICEIKIEP